MGALKGQGWQMSWRKGVVFVRRGGRGEGEGQFVLWCGALQDVCMLVLVEKASWDLLLHMMARSELCNGSVCLVCVVPSTPH